VEFDVRTDHWGQNDVSINGITFDYTRGSYLNKRPNQISAINLTVARERRSVRVLKDGTINLDHIRQRYQELLDGQIQRNPDYLAKHEGLNHQRRLYNALEETLQIRADRNITLISQRDGFRLQFDGLSAQAVIDLVTYYRVSHAPSEETAS
jgi:hypothetical protein